MEDVAPVVQVLESPDYTEMLELIHEDLLSLQEVSGYVEGFLLFAVVVALCWFTYKFFRLFF